MTAVTTAAFRNAQRAIFAQIKVGDTVVIRSRDGRVFCEAFSTAYTTSTQIEVAEVGKNYVRDIWGQQFSYMQIDRIIR